MAKTTNRAQTADFICKSEWMRYWDENDAPEISPKSTWEAAWAACSSLESDLSALIGLKMSVVTRYEVALLMDRNKATGKYEWVVILEPVPLDRSAPGVRPFRYYLLSDAIAAADTYVANH